MKPTLQQGATMAEDSSRVRIQMVDGRHLEARGTLEDVAAFLRWWAALERRLRRRRWLLDADLRDEWYDRN
jgi:hypothetical protein